MATDVYYMVTDGIQNACIPSVHLPTEIPDGVSRQLFDGQQVYIAGVIIHTKQNASYAMLLWIEHAPDGVSF
jgi:hypothetical protein